MPTFEYQATNSAGEKVSGTVLGASIEQALLSLSNHGLTVERINQSLEGGVEAPPRQSTAYEQRSPYGSAVQGPSTEQRSYMATSVVGPLTGKVPLKVLTMFYRQFGTMLEAGVPIVQALDTLSRQGSSIKMHSVVQEIRGHVEAGRAISAGMQRYPEVFPPLALSLVRAGEEGGFVSQTFKLLADYTDQEIALRNLIRRLTIQPKLTLGVLVVVFAIVNIVIKSLGKSSILSSPFLEPITWVILIPLAIGAFLFFRVGLANPRIKYNWDRFLVSVPFGVGKTVHEFAMSKFGLAMAFLHQGGVPVHNSIRLAADACGNEYVRSQIAPASRRLESGDGIADTLRDTQAFSPIVMDMVDTGERTGNLEHMLRRMSDFYQEEAQTRATQVAHIFSVLVYLAVAALVLMVLISSYQNYAAGITSVGGDE